MDIILKISAIGVLISCFCVFFKKTRPEYAIFLVIATGVFIFAAVGNLLVSVKDFVDTLSDTAGISPAILSPVFKIVGIGIVSNLSAQVCKGVDEDALAAFIDTAGAIVSVYIALPLLKAVLQMITEFI